MQGIEAIIERQQVCLRKATIIASSAWLRTVDLGNFGPIGASLVEVLRFHLRTVFGLIPWRPASALMLS